MLSNAVQFLNAKFPIAVSLFGSLISLNDLHPEKVEDPIVVMVSNKGTFSNFSAFENKSPTTLSVPASNVTLVKPLP